MKILVLGLPRYAEWAFDEFEALQNKIESVEIADLIVFTGGSDVDPSVYGHKKHKSTYSDLNRDKFEQEIYIEALRLSKPMLGICRGSQFLTACQPNGMLVQNVGGHAIGALHHIEFIDGQKELITSTHHQMMYPFNVKNYELIAWASPTRSEYYNFGDTSEFNLPGNIEPEVVFYPETKCLCIQGHPEGMSKLSPTVKKLKELIITKLIK